jgi:hypothetical protein
MKKLLLIFTLLFSTLMFSIPSYAEWTKVDESISGISYYLDFDRIRKHGEYVYYWELVDYLKPTKYGKLSGKTYYQGDCKLFRDKGLSFSFYKEPMGRGTPATSSNVPAKDWYYPPPNSVSETTLKRVCSQ